MHYMFLPMDIYQNLSSPIYICIYMCIYIYNIIAYIVLYIVLVTILFASLYMYCASHNCIVDLVHNRSKNIKPNNSP